MNKGLFYKGEYDFMHIDFTLDLEAIKAQAKTIAELKEENKRLIMTLEKCNDFDIKGAE